MGATFLAKRSASAFTLATARSRTAWSLGLPRTTPRAFAACSASLVRCAIISRSCCATARKDVNGELVGVGIIDGDKFNARIHQRCDESEIVGQAIQLDDNQLGPLPLADRQSLLEFGPLVALTALDLGELADQRPSATIQVVVDSLVLRLEAKAGFPLLVSG